jgi:ribokinase
MRYEYKYNTIKSGNMKKILVIGSSNTDLIYTVENFPTAGETIKAKSSLQAMGGKGANQAVAAHRLGGHVKFITCLGNDSNGQNTLNHYREEGLNVSDSLIVENVPSGTAIILVNEQGENCIVVNSGANNMLLPSHILEMEYLILEADMVVLQMEIPHETVRLICKMAHSGNKKVMLNAAPACKLDRELLTMIDILIVNETEAEIISGEKMEIIGDKGLLHVLSGLGVGTVVLTLGDKGCMLKNDHEAYSIPAFKVKAIDTTAAGDTFCGALAAELNRGHDWEAALIYASAASAICVTRMGAQPSIPTEIEVFEFLGKTKLKGSR